MKRIDCPECGEEMEVPDALIHLDTYQCVDCGFIIDLLTQRATWLLAPLGVLCMIAALVL